MVQKCIRVATIGLLVPVLIAVLIGLRSSPANATSTLSVRQDGCSASSVVNLNCFQPVPATAHTCASEKPAPFAGKLVRPGTSTVWVHQAKTGVITQKMTWTDRNGCPRNKSVHVISIKTKTPRYSGGRTVKWSQPNGVIAWVIIKGGPKTQPWQYRLDYNELKTQSEQTIPPGKFTFDCMISTFTPLSYVPFVQPE
jgi:hypothetical protein